MLPLHAVRPDGRTVEPAVLEVVSGLVDELGGRTGGRPVELDNALDRELGSGTREILPAGAWLPAPGPITVAVGASILPDGEGWPAMIRLRDRARAEVVRRSGEPPVDRHPTPATRAGDPDDR